MTQISFGTVATAIYLCYNLNMEDKRIKSFAVDMSIAWGLVCWLILLIDMGIWHLGVSILYIQCGRTVPVYPLYSLIALWIINISCLVSTFIVVTPAEYCGLRGNYLIYIISAVQILIYWYLGSLIGRFIIWQKKTRNKPEKKE